jgi:hypothetical protein
MILSLVKIKFILVFDPQPGKRKARSILAAGL